ncbi:MAG: hypothetical protein N2039_09440 [Gemmataceae bacterium]|nr:hypothetical protein [Gemmataceae bacterium]
MNPMSGHANLRHRPIPWSIKLGYTVWVVVWAVLYKQFVDWNHYLWLCHLGNVVIALGLWLESPLLLSWQALALLIPDLIWSVDFLIGLSFETTPLGSAWYMFHPAFPPLQKGLALFHLFLPLLLIGCLVRYGYDRRALWLQIGYCWLIFPVSYMVSSETDNINWVLGPFGQVQRVVPPPVYLVVAMVAYVLVLYLPAHGVLCWLVRAPRQAEELQELPPSSLWTASGESAVAERGHSMTGQGDREG